jgi:hypothetical protein
MGTDVGAAATQNDLPGALNAEHRGSLIVVDPDCPSAISYLGNCNRDIDHVVSDLSRDMKKARTSGGRRYGP